MVDDATRYSVAKSEISSEDELCMILRLSVINR